MPHADSEHGLRVQLATALRERDEWNREAGLLRAALITWQGNAEKTAAERDALHAEVKRLREALDDAASALEFRGAAGEAVVARAALASPAAGGK